MTSDNTSLPIHPLLVNSECVCCVAPIFHGI